MNKHRILSKSNRWIKTIIFIQIAIVFLSFCRRTAPKYVFNGPCYPPYNPPLFYNRTHNNHRVRRVPGHFSHPTFSVLCHFLLSTLSNMFDTSLIISFFEFNWFHLSSLLLIEKYFY